MAREIHIDHQNLGTVNKNKVRISTDKGSVDLFFSYNTIVAVDSTVSKNIWSVTTGKLLNQLQPNKSKRVPYNQVLKKAQSRLKEIL
jgi:hypothetical protein